MSAISEFKTQTNFKTSLSDGGYSGITARVEVNANSFGKFAVMYMTANGYELANAANDTKTPARVMALEAGTGSEISVLKAGFIKNSAWSFTKGAAIYLGTTDGTITQTKPSSSNNAVQYIGDAYDATTLDFRPDATIVTIA
ncbi:MAG: hypothetical protein DRO67_03965 [Candidatus Asgardarchaeum californiense]|nr:MAG: hypothetical protein DRO67_03965 [Candidatus Asgardarchaeum californiense]